MDALRAMEVFVAVADRGGFAPAARVLGLSRSSVSRLVGGLEDRLGTQLLNRTTRHLSLTAAGEELLGRCRRVVNDADDVLQAKARAPARPAGRLRVTMPLFLGTILMDGVVARFALEHPEVDLDVLLVDRVVNIVEEGFDLAVRVGQMPDSSLVARKFLDLDLALTASPEYVARRGQPVGPEDLRDHQCIIDTAAPYKDRWPLWVDGGTRRVQVKSHVTVNVGSAARDLAVGGAGLALLPEYLVLDDIRRGRLVPLLGEYMMDYGGAFIVYPRSRYPSSAVQGFADRLVESSAPIRKRRERHVAERAGRGGKSGA